MLSPKISNSLIDGFASQGFGRGVSYQELSPLGEGSRTMDVVRGVQAARLRPCTWEPEWNCC